MEGWVDFVESKNFCFIGDIAKETFLKLITIEEESGYVLMKTICQDW